MASISSLGFQSTDLEKIDEITFNVGIYHSVSSFQMEHLVEMGCGEIYLVIDVLDTFCVQGREHLDSLEIAMEQENIPCAVNVAVRDLPMPF
jgi:hypothetical protein